MKTKMFFMGLLFGFIFPGYMSAAEALSPDQILNIMEASRSRYRNLEAMIQEQTFQKIGSASTPTLMGTTTFTIRMTPGRRYLDMDMQTHADQRINKIERYVLTPNKAKRYRLNRNDNVASGLVAQSQSMQGIHVHAVYDAIWGIQNVPWDLVHQRIHTASVYKDQDFYVLEFQYEDSDQSTGLRIVIDPDKEYVPVSHSVLHADKTILSRVETRNWTKIDNLWIPMAYTYAAPTFGFRQEFEVQSIALNRPITDSQMDFDFPEGTTVDDRLRGVEYRVPKANSPQASLSVETLSPLATPAGDLELTQIAAKSDEIIIQQQSVASSPEQPVISPAFVWVLPGKNQYALELSQDTKTKPVLSGKTISDSPLVLHSVEDQLASSGKLIVTLERPMDHKAFADTVLTLDFGGIQTPIHFVAAPLP